MECVLIEVIQQYPLIYDLRSKDYKNVKLKENAWKEIASVVNSTVDECQRLWRSIRDRYTKEKRDHLKSGSSPRETRWHLFEKMQFYEKYSRPRQSYTSTSSGASSSRPHSVASVNSSLSWDMGFIADEDIEEGLQAEGVQVGGEAGPSISAITAESRITTDMHPSSTPTRRAAKRKGNEEELELLKIAKNLASSIKPKENDTNRAFTEYVYSLLREMPIAKAKTVRNKILRVLLEEDSD